MKLVHPNLGSQIVFAENKVNVLTIENRKLFVDFVQELILQIDGEEGNFILSEKEKELSLEKSCNLIIDPFNIDINNKKVLHKIYLQLKEISMDEYNYLSTTKIKSDVLQYLEKITYNCDVPLGFDDDFDIAGLFKILDVKIEDENTSLLEKITNYISILSDVLGIRCFIFINLKQFLSYDELSEFYKFLSYNKLFAFLIESSFTTQTHECEKHYIIDPDLCEIY